jgi:methionyl-tRNA synthetase
VQRIEEKNYKFKIGSFREDLIRWIKNTSRKYSYLISNYTYTITAIRPFQRQEEVLAFLSDPSTLPDLSVSRPANRVQWGIPVPDDPSQTIYVWLDALTSYLTAIGFPWSSAVDMTSGGWPADIHVVGKDILW